MLEIKAAMHASDALARRLKRLDEPVRLAVECCDAFLSRFDAGPTGPPDRVEVEQERAYIQCHFHKARALGKLEKPDSLVASLRAYEFIHKYCARNQPEGSEDEVSACAEMIELLPMKIAQAQRALATS